MPDRADPPAEVRARGRPRLDGRKEPALRYDELSQAHAGAFDDSLARPGIRADVGRALAELRPSAPAA